MKTSRVLQYTRDHGTRIYFLKEDLDNDLILMIRGFSNAGEMS